MPPRTSNDDGPLRQAPAADPIPASTSPAVGANGSEGPHQRSWIRWAIAVLVGLALAGGVAWFVLTQGGVTPAPPGTSQPRVTFAFAAPTVHVRSYTGKTSKGPARTVAEDIRATLSTLYGRAFVDPATWAGGFPPQMWEAFDPNAAARAQKEAASFGLGRVEGLGDLDVIAATLAVDVLEDPAKRPLSATATVRFTATGTRTDGSILDVRNTATYLFRPVKGRWLIVGFPSLRTTIDSVPPPVPSAGPSAGATATPSPTGGSG